MTLNGKNIVGNNLVGDGTVFYAYNPALREAIQPSFHEATTEEIESAIEGAAGAFPEYGAKTGEEKARFLEAIADEIIKTGDALIERCNQETALPVARLLGERTRTVNQLKLFASHLRDGSWVQARIDRGDANRKPIPRPDVRCMMKPLGPVGIFGASNFPLAFSVAGGDTASALAAGCPIVVKAHPLHPGTSEMVGSAIRRAVAKTGMPAGTFSLLQGKSNAVGMAIVNHPGIKAIGFTGSYVGGKALFDAANKRPVPIPVFAEMGSSNPVFILPEALKQRKDAIGKDLIASVTLGVGQFCTSPGLVFLENNSDGQSFKGLMADVASKWEPEFMLSQDIQDNFYKRVEKLRGTTGVEALAGARSVRDLVHAHVFAVDVNSFINDCFLEEEVFGPSTILVLGTGREQILEAARKLSGHLTATIHGTENDLAEYRQLIQILESKVGRIIINGYPTGVEVCHAMVHGGPYPATTASQTTSVGTLAINRFGRPVSYQNFPDTLLPDEIKNANSLGIWRLIDGNWTKTSC